MTIPLLAGGLLLALAPSPRAQGTVLNDPLPAGIAGDVLGFAVAPDATRVVYAADDELDGTVGLHSVPIEGGASVRLDPALGLTGSEPSFTPDLRITADARQVVYRGLGDGLFGVPIDGGALPEPLSAAGLVVTSFELTRDSRFAVYLALPAGQGVSELYVVPVTGGVPRRLNGDLVPGGRVFTYQLAPDSRRVVYLAEQATEEFSDLYSVALDGSPPIRLHPGLPGERIAGDFRVTANSKGVVFRIEDRSMGVASLWTTPLAGGARLELSASDVESFRLTPAGGEVVLVRDGALFRVAVAGGPLSPLGLAPVAPEYVDEYVLSPDSKRVVYRTESHRGEGSYPLALYSAPITGGPTVLLARPDGRYVAQPLVSPDSRRIVYRLFDFSGQDELWSAPLAGGAGVRLVAEETYYAAIDPGSSRLAYVVARRLHNPESTVLELHSVPLDGGAATRLSGALIEQGNVQVQRWAEPGFGPDGARVVYVADQEHDEVLELYSVPLGGGPAVRLDGALAPGGTAGDVERFEVSPDGRHVLYRADQAEDDVFELFAVRLGPGAARAPSVRLNGPLVRNGDVSAALFRASPDSRRVVFVADDRVAGIGELFSVPIEGGAALRLNARPGLGLGVHGFEISPDARHVAFLDDADEPFRPRPFSVPLGGGPNVALGADVLALDFVNDLAVSSDSRRVVFAALHSGEAALELYSIPIGGGTLARLNPTPVAGGRVGGGFRILPDARAVVYAGDLERDDVTELYLAPIEGGPSVKLSGASIANGDVSSFAVSADSRHVVYRADSVQDQVVELFAVRLADGVRVKLNPPLVAGGDVQGFVIAPDSAHVVYLADQAANDVVELFAVPIGGGVATRLNGPLAPGGDVHAAGSGTLVTPAGRVLYRALQSPGVIELFSASLAGGTPVRLNDPLAPGESVAADFALSGDGRRVVFRAGREPFLASFHFELFAVPPEGGRPPERLSAPLVDYGSVAPSADDHRAFRLAGPYALYRADQSEAGSHELHLSLLHGEAGRPRRR